MGFRIPRLYAIIDPAQTRGLAPGAVAEMLLTAGVRLIQYRGKTETSRRLFDVSCEMADLVHRAGGTFIVNDRADLARLAGADGVHVGQEDLPVELARRVLLPGQWVGVSTHTQAQMEEAEASSADYVAFGPVFPTASKERPDPVVGLERLRQVRGLTRKPLVAIGGITLANAPSVIEAGADSVAVIHDLLAAEDIGAQARKYLQALG
ncbi:MAG TPA: thiamine phosphate synthase [Terriglobia bacterium]|nr:thiamine phosphate synthase [Terriglobia bacterium]